MKKRLDDFHASDEEQISRHKLHEDLYLESEISEDIELRSLSNYPRIQLNTFRKISKNLASKMSPFSLKYKN